MSEPKIYADVWQSGMHAIGNLSVPSGGNGLFVRLEDYRALAATLPESMVGCTLVFVECPLGHSWLTATNWVQHACQTCEINRLKALVSAAEAEKS